MRITYLKTYGQHCLGHKCVELYLHFPIYLHSMVLSLVPQTTLTYKQWTSHSSFGICDGNSGTSIACPQGRRS
jgi:hypothetical protein